VNDAAAVRALAALAQESRLRVFRLLVVAGPGGETPGRIAEALDIAPTSLSFHLKELVLAGLVSQQRVGRHLVYRSCMESMNDLVVFLTSNCCAGKPCALVPAVHCIEA
jgi:DNA-binding transcriptional ArsR family regulator